MKEENEMKDLVKYLTCSAELEKKKEELSKISAELKNVDSAVEILENSKLKDLDIAKSLYKYWDALNKKEKTLKYAIAKLELEIAKFELDQAYAE